jgi:hypothetical protein
MWRSLYLILPFARRLLEGLRDRPVPEPSQARLAVNHDGRTHDRLVTEARRRIFVKMVNAQVDPLFPLGAVRDSGYQPLIACSPRAGAEKLKQDF